jgi:hypothetical protein
VRDSEELELSLSINNAAVRCDKIRVKVPLRGGHQPPLPVEVTTVGDNVLKLLRLETITFSEATLSNISVVLCYVLSQYH